MITPALATDPAVSANPASLFNTYRSYATTQGASVRGQVAKDRGVAC